MSDWPRCPGSLNCTRYQPDETVQGMLQLLFELQQELAEISGLPGVSLQPAAGAQGELTALMVAAAYFRDTGPAADQGADARQCPRHQSGQCPDGRLRDDHDSQRSGRPRRPGGAWKTSWTTSWPCS